ncbi:hypothetical protein F8388_002873 [Cannabis sativa]|uniref:DUF4283 domain-containing protein n=1 Tax=Cannabis sativa TaxID=3483 RepID=A0A7J6FMK8_CANSA|nr:hypothetical protein F8388_002873 [Cannabis sativa]
MGRSNFDRVKFQPLKLLIFWGCLWGRTRSNIRRTLRSREPKQMKLRMMIYLQILNKNESDSQKFNDTMTRDMVLEEGVVQFDKKKKKPIIIRPWSTDITALSLVKLVPLWIRLHDLGLHYWGNKCLSAIVSTIGKPIMTDKITKERSMSHELAIHPCVKSNQKD